MERMFFHRSADNFCETLLIGNGRLGAAVYGGVCEDVYDLNDDTLWSGYPRDCIYDGTDSVKEKRKYIFTEKEGYIPNCAELTKEFAEDCKGTKQEIFERVKEYLIQDKVEKAQPLLEQLYGTYCQSYQPAGCLKIKGEYGEFSEYERALTLGTAIQTTGFKTATGAYRREAFASYPDDVIVIRYEGDGKLPSTEIALESKLRASVSFENGTLIMDGEAPGDTIPSYLFTGEPDYRDDPAERGMRYAVALRVKSDGAVSCGDTCLYINGAKWFEIYLTVKTSFAGYDRHPYLDGIDYKSELLKILDAVTAPSITYHEVKARHIEDFSSLFDRVKLYLGEGREDLPTDERLKAHQKQKDPGMYVLLYQFGRYMMISSSRPGSQPTNLQGIWNNELFPAWSSNYTTNINVQMNYWGMCGANLSECCEPLHRMIYELSEVGKRTASKLYGADGFCVHHNTDLWRMTYPPGDWATETTQFAYFPLAGAWLTAHLYYYYLETKDTEFLGEKAFDAIVGSAEFCDSMLTEYDGKLIFCPASSPENGYLKNGRKYAIAKSSAMFQSLVREAFEICISACDILGRKQEYARYLENRLARIPWLECGSDGRILEWDEEREENNVFHRHLSHLYSFYPSGRVTDKRLLDACRLSLEARGDESMSWSSVWKICLWSELNDAERALKIADILLSYVDSKGERKVMEDINNSEDKEWGNGFDMVNFSGTLPNLLCCCPPFQMDGNYGFVAAVNGMLARERNGKVELLPALPALWRNGEVKGLRVNGKTVNVKWENGKIISSSVTE